MFEENAIEAIINVANGTPRIINKICNSALLIADNKKVDIVSTEIIMMAVKERELG